MIDKIEISATIVLHNEEINEVKKSVSSFLNTPISKRLYLIDNSPINKLEGHFLNFSDVEYQFIGKNLGFSKGHNLVIDKIKNSSDYHLILNPDVAFESNVIPELIAEMENNKELALITPKVIFPNGKHQHSCRRYPTMIELLVRRLGFPKYIIEKGEYKDKNLSKPFYPDFVQGCFQLFRTKDLVKIKGFDERYFLYMEDIDICKKIDQLGKKKLYYPNVKITHILKRQSSKNLPLLFTHFNSSIKYFKKWGF